jgi:glycogen debranching enzyme
MYLFNKKLILTAAMLYGSLCHAQPKNVVYDAGKYIVYRDSIVQGKYVAKVISQKELISNYRSPANEFKSSAISFKFSINGKDNEMKSGIDHHVVIVPENGMAETPLIKFGTQLNENSKITSYLAANTHFKIRLDLRDVMKAFKTQGYYSTFNGDKIYQNDFKGVYVAGSAAPLTWDFDNLVHHPKLQLQDEDNDGIFEVVLNMNSAEEDKSTATKWQASKDFSAFPSYNSEYPISDVLYNLSLEEMLNAVENDSTFRTGKEWAGVWTRDVSYSIILSMAYLQPRVAIKSLLRKVSAKGTIIQDTGTGGAWPTSTDRMIWAVAAWEIYKVTGDKSWLQKAYTIIKNSIDDDLNTIYNKQTGLVKGESSFLDWREQTYPSWMQPADIFESECLGTNAVHYQANRVLSEMATILNKKAESEKYLNVARKIKTGINQFLWQPSKNYYGQFLYGRNSKILSPRSEALGEALVILFDIAEKQKQKQIISNTPVTDYGISCIYPQIPDIPPYHNNAVWPFVQTYWLWAAAKSGNEKAVMESIAAIYRPAALFLTNKENFVADNGDFSGTQINSNNMLWSLSGNLSIVHNVLFGIRYQEKKLVFEPFVPQALKGRRKLSNFKYRDAILDMEMEGYGNIIKEFLLDGEAVKPEISSSINGRHRIKIVLENNNFEKRTINKLPNYTTLSAPEVIYSKGKLLWVKQPAAKIYKVLKNGKLVTVTTDVSYMVKAGEYAEYQVIAVDIKGYESFASEPFAIVNNIMVNHYEMEQFYKKAEKNYNGFSGSGFIEISKATNKMISIPVTAKEEGWYAIDFRYANGNGPINTENKCAIRTLQIDHKAIGTVIFPQRGKEEWSNWGWSNSTQLHLTKGKHLISLVYEKWNENMNSEINQAMIDLLRMSFMTKKQRK